METNNNPASAATKGELLLEWSARPYHVHERSERWYKAAGTVAVLIALYAILTGAWSFAIVILLSVAMYVLVHGHEPKEQSIALYDQGVFFRGRFTDWHDYKGFFLKKTPQYTELHLVPANRRMPRIALQTGAVDPQMIRQTLSVYVPQLSDAEESVLDMIIRSSKL